MSKTNFDVKFAVYGALAGGNENNTQAVIVTEELSSLLNNAFLEKVQDGVLKIDNNTMGSDPAEGSQKHFGAIVNVNGTGDHPFACVEGQTIYFIHPGMPS